MFFFFFVMVDKEEEFIKENIFDVLYLNFMKYYFVYEDILCIKEF